VISHLEELQKEIETYIKVTNTEDQGSVIAESWV
jgi:DNA repair exonuclease SbcCD ATPase subunit